MHELLWSGADNSLGFELFFQVGSVCLEGNLEGFLRFWILNAGIVAEQS